MAKSRNHPSNDRIKRDPNQKMRALAKLTGRIGETLLLSPSLDRNFSSQRRGERGVRRKGGG